MVSGSDLPCLPESMRTLDRREKGALSTSLTMLMLVAVVCASVVVGSDFWDAGCLVCR